MALADHNRASANRAVRKVALRDQLQAQGHLQHVVDLTTKIMDEEISIDPEMLGRYKIAIDAKLKLINKYCPDLKAIEMQIGGDITQYVISAEPIDAEHWEEIYSLETPAGASKGVN